MANSSCAVTCELSKYLQTLLGTEVDLRINQNRRTMLSVLEKSRKHVRVSMHEMFLTAPKEVVEAAACFIKSQEPKTLKVLQFYIHEQMTQKTIEKGPQDEATPRDPVQTLGRFYDLEKEWAIVNKNYFDSSLNLNLSWFGEVEPKRRTRVTLGLYDKMQNLVKVHRRLDTPETPRYYLQFVLYHEALHKIYPPYLGPGGVMKIHHETFKKHEKQFREYSLARHFEQLGKKIWFDL